MPLANIAVAALLFASPNVAGKPAVHLQAWQETEPQTPPSKDAPPEAQPKAEAPKVEPQVSPATPTAKPTASKPKTKSSRKRKSTAKKTDPPQSEEGPTKVVVRNGSTNDPSLDFSNGATKEQASHQVQNTNQLLASAESNLKKMAVRQATPSQQETMKQVRMYMDQAKVAMNGGDLQRGHNLALKARLLSDELVQH